MDENIELCILPRQTMSWEEFVEKTPRNSISLDGIISSSTKSKSLDYGPTGLIVGGPGYDPRTNTINFDHHFGVVRDATMSTSRQVYLAVKTGLFHAFMENGKPQAHVYVNDPDQDTAVSVFLLKNHKLFENAKSMPEMERFLHLVDMLDVTAGSFPIDFSDKLVRQQNWVFEDYNEFRKSGALAKANAEEMKSNLEKTILRINEFTNGKAGEKDFDTRHKIFYKSPHGYWAVNEIGGNEARCYLFSQGMEAYISLVATRPDKRFVYAIGRRSGYIKYFDVNELVDVFNEEEGLTRENGWGCPSGTTSNVGGSSRMLGSGINWERLAELADKQISQKIKSSIHQ